MMRIGLPRRAVALVRLVAPACPTGAGAAREQLEIGPGAACLDDGVLFVGLARMLALAGGEKIHLPTARRKRARIPALDAEQDQFGHVAEVEADAAPVGAAVLAHLVPDEVGLVGEAPRLHHGKTFRQQGVRAPQIKVRYRRRDLPHRQRHDLIETERAIARQTPVLGRDLAGLVGELPGRVRQDGCEAPLTCESEEIGGHAHAVVRQSDSGERTMAPSGEHPQVPGAASSTSLFASSESWARIIAARPHTGREDLSWQKVKCAAPRKRRSPRPTTTRSARAAPPPPPRRSPASARPNRAQTPTARSKKRGPVRGLFVVLAGAGTYWLPPELLPPELLPPELLPPELPRAGLDEEPPDEPVVEREPPPLGWLMDDDPVPDRLDAPCREVLVDDEPVVVRELVPVLTLTPGLERRCTNVRLSPWIATPGR